MLITRLVRPKGRGVRHVVHETETSRLHEEIHVLCGKRFSPQTCDAYRNQTATCPECLRLNNPFGLSSDQEIAFWKNATKVPGAKLRQDLFVRDLFNIERGPNGQFLLYEPRLSAKGDVLKRDIMTCVPWNDADGVFHRRRAMFRSRAVCGAVLYGLREMTFTKLDQLMELHKDAKVDCIECLANPYD